MANLSNRKALFRLFTTTFIDMLSFGIFITILPFVFSDGEEGLFSSYYSNEVLKLIYGWLIGTYSIGLFIGAPLLGVISDKIGRKKVLLFANTINVLSYFILAAGVYYQSLVLIYIGRIVPGFLGNTILTLQSAIADVSTHEDKAKNFGLTGVAFGLGFIMGMLMVVGLTQLPNFSYEMGFIIGGLLNFINLIYMQLFVPETLKEKSDKSIDILSGIKNINAAFRIPSFRLLFTVIFMLTIGFSFFSQFAQFYLIEKFDFKIEDVGKLFLFVGLVTAFTQGVLLRWASNTFSLNAILKVGMLLFSIGYVALLLPQSVWQLYLAVGIMVVFQGLCFPSALAVVSNSASADDQGEIIGINQSIQALANGIPPLLFGYAVGISVSFPIWFAAVCTFIAWLIYYIFGKNID